MHLFLKARFSSNELYPDLVVDIETTGTNPQFGAIIQLSAIAFNYETEDVGPHFDRCLRLAPNRFWDESTREWWGRQKAATLMGILQRAEDPLEVVSDFAAWVGEHAPQAAFWSRGSFDWYFIQSYMEQYGFPMPFPFWMARDLRAFQAGLAGSREEPDLSHITLKGDKHNALYDCALQLKRLFAAKNKDFANA